MSKVNKKVNKKPSLFVRLISNLIGALLYIPRKLFGFIGSSVAGLAIGVWRVRLMRPFIIGGLPLAFIFLFFTLPIFTPTANIIKPYIWHYSAAAGFRIDYVDVEGRKRTQRKDLQKAVGLQRGQPIFTIDLHAIHNRVLALPWVREAIIMRRLPDRVNIIVREYEPFALYQDGKDKVLVNRAGVKITRQHLKQFRNLPTFSGAGVLPRAAGLMDLLADYPVVRNRLAAAHWAGQRRWDLVLDHGGTIHLPESDIRTALDRLMQQERQRRVLAQKQVIDLRLPDRILLRPINADDVAPKTAGESLL
ncbi:MAG: FtsQ-type POTRA domain-containing protein [Alphaproteobacteria bacterium]|nr:FtsQ-type POTRA domain-containing protein [Alphaproteobacteria bacterium]